MKGSGRESGELDFWLGVRGTWSSSEPSQVISPFEGLKGGEWGTWLTRGKGDLKLLWTLSGYQSIWRAQGGGVGDLID